MDTSKMINEALGSAVLKSTPVGSVALASAWGIALSDWTMIIAILVGVAQIIYTITSTVIKWRNRNRRWNDEQK